jgi:hypothetical protein
MLIKNGFFFLSPFFVYVNNNIAEIPTAATLDLPQPEAKKKVDRCKENKRNDGRNKR